MRDGALGRATRSGHLCRGVPASIYVLFSEPVDYLIRNDRTPATKWTKAKEGLIMTNLFRISIFRTCQTAPGKFGQDPAGGLTFPSCQFFGSQQNIIIDVQCGSHASDDIASHRFGQRPVAIGVQTFAVHYSPFSVHRSSSGFGVRGLEFGVRGAKRDASHTHLRSVPLEAPNRSPFGARRSSCCVRRWAFGVRRSLKPGDLD